MPCVIRPLVSIFLLLAIASVAMPRVSSLSQRADAAMQSRIAGLAARHDVPCTRLLILGDAMRGYR